MLSKNWPCATLLGAAAVMAGGAHAQSAAPPAPLKYESPFTGYQPYRDAKRGNWRELNDTVGVMGGPNAHLLGAVVQVLHAQGTVIEVDKANARVRLDHEAIKEAGWPAATAFWPLKEAALADRIKPGERIGFRLELTGDAYKIADVGPAGVPLPGASPPAANPHAGHAGHARPAAPAVTAPPKPAPAPVDPHAGHRRSQP